MCFKFKLSNRLALLKASLAASAILTLACTGDLTDPQLHRSSSTAVPIAADLAPLAATTVVASAYQDPNVPQYTLDGNLATRWSANGDGQWIRYDLGSTMTIGSISIAWYLGTSWQSAFELQVSLDGMTWSPVFTGRSSGRTLQPERYDFPAVPARYVRIVGHGQWNGTTLSSWWNSITEVAVSASTTAPVSSAWVVAVAASVYQDPNVPQNTRDGNLATRWSANGDGQWIRYDLGSTMTVGSIAIAWYLGTSWQSAFELQVSLDGATWSPVYTGRSSGQTLQPERYDFPAVPARYVRIVGHGQWNGSTLSSWWNSITEVVIYASTTGTGTPAPVATVSVSPASPSIAVGRTMQLTATPCDAAGHALTGRAVTWKTSNGAVATVSATGLVTGVSAGTVAITATSEAVTGTATGTMTAPGSGAPQPGPSDPIIFQDGFESGDLSSWTQDPSAGRYSLATAPARVHSGTHSLQALFTPSNGYGLITRWFMPGYDEVFVKFYVMFQEGFKNQRSDGAGMHFLVVCANNINDSRSCWGKPAIVPNGTDYVYAGLDPEEVSLPTLQPLSFYTYWPGMSCCYGNVQFQPSPKVAPATGQWQEVVFHIKLNTPGQSDGLQEVWLNGVKKLSQQNMRWRSTTDLRLNEVRFDNYMPGAPQTQYLWVDDITVWRP